MAFLMGLLKSIIAAPLLERAQRKIIERDYMGAIKSIGSLSKVVGLEFPSEVLPIRANIIVLQASYWVDDSHLSIQSARVVKNQLLDRYTRAVSADFMYTVAYVCGFVRFCSAKFPQHEDELYSIFNELSSISEPFEMSKVSSNLKYEMPLGSNRL